MLKSFALIILSAFILSSCAFLHAYSIALAADYDGKSVIKNEKNVVSYLENVIENHGAYSMRAFDRKAISPKVKKQPGYIHCFYVIYAEDETYNTLSFSATGKLATSRGAWAMNTETDVSSYVDYLTGSNIWEVVEITPKNSVNTQMTLNNVLLKIQSNKKYYFRAKINKNDKYDNCYTALLETIVEND